MKKLFTLIVLNLLLVICAHADETIISLKGKNGECQQKMDKIQTLLDRKGIMAVEANACRHCNNCAETEFGSLQIVDPVSTSTFQVVGKDGECAQKLSAQLAKLKKAGRVAFELQTCEYCPGCAQTKQGSIMVVTKKKD